MAKRLFWAAGAGLAAAALLQVAVREGPSASALFPSADLYRKVEQFRDVLEVVHRNYLDPEEATLDRLTESALKGMLRDLDPHSEFMARREYEELQADTSQEYGGIGIHVEWREGKLTVIAPIRGTPADRAGVLRGDQVLRVDGASVEGLGFEELVTKLRGKPGTEVSVAVRRPATGEEHAYTMRREKIEVASVSPARWADREAGIGYVAISNFYEKTGDEFRAALDGLEADGMRALVLDLRNNPGGLLSAAVDVAGQFFERNELIVYTEGRDARTRQDLRQRGKPRATRYPIAVLVNAGSASASEIVAGALQDTRRAVVVGERTFGKGLVQSVLPLRTGEAVRLTTAQYHTPGGAVIQERGVSPDIDLPIPLDEEQRLRLWLARSDLLAAEEFEQRYGDRPPADRQLAAAADALRAVLLVDAARGAPVAAAPGPGVGGVGRRGETGAAGAVDASGAWAIAPEAERAEARPRVAL